METPLEAFNRTVPIGAAVRFLDERGQASEGVTRSLAFHSRRGVDVVLIEGADSPVPIARCQPLTEPRSR